MPWTFARVVMVIAMALVGAGCSSSAPAKSAPASPRAGSTAGSAGRAPTAPGISPTAIKIGYISSLTGTASSTFADGPAGAQARIDEQNSRGGIDGRKLVLAVRDDQSSPAQFLTAAQELVGEDNAFAVIAFSSFTFGGYRYLQQHGVPVVGLAFDGDEWFNQPNNNMFSDGPSVYADQGHSRYSYGYLGSMLKDIGVTRLAGLAYGDSPSSQASVEAAFASARQEGIGSCYQNLSVPFGAVDFTASVLAIKAAHCDGVVGSLVDASDVALSATLKRGGYTGKQLYYTGYDQDVASNPAAAAAFQGDYVLSGVRLTTANPAVASMFNALHTYDPNYKAGLLPDLGLYGSYLATDLMIRGLEAAGTGPTRQSFITRLRNVRSYTADGFLPTPVTFGGENGFGTPAMFPTSACYYLVQLKGTRFVTVGPDGGLVCGDRFNY